VFDIYDYDMKVLGTHILYTRSNFGEQQSMKLW